MTDDEIQRFVHAYKAGERATVEMVDAMLAMSIIDLYAVLVVWRAVLAAKREAVR